MDKLIRFSDYDVFGCLSTGLGALIVIDLIAETDFVLGGSWSVSDAAILIWGSYILGQILATPSAWLIERQLVFTVFGRPPERLVQPRPNGGLAGVLAKTVMGEYFTPLPKSVQDRLSNAAGKNFSNPEALFHIAMVGTNDNALVRAKMETFLKLYGFCRNNAFVAIVGGLLLGGKSAIALLSDDPSWLSIIGLSLLSLLIGIGLLQRYLKFLRLYHLTLLANFAGTGRELEQDANAAA